MSDTLYIQTDKNMKVTREIVTLGEIADLSCKNSAVLARNQVRKVASLPREKYGRYVISMIDVIGKSKKRNLRWKSVISESLPLCSPMKIPQRKADCSASENHAGQPDHLRRGRLFHYDL